MGWGARLLHVRRVPESAAPRAFVFQPGCFVASRSSALRTSAQHLLCCEGCGQLCRPRIGLRAAEEHPATFHRQGGRAAPRPRAPSASTPNSASRPRDTRPRRKPSAPLAFFASFTGLRLLGLGLRAVPHALQVGLQPNSNAGEPLGRFACGLATVRPHLPQTSGSPAPPETAEAEATEQRSRKKDASLELPAFARAACKADRSACIGLRHRFAASGAGGVDRVLLVSSGSE